MAIPDELSFTRKLLYENLKKPFLDENLGREESLQLLFPKQEFVAMITDALELNNPSSAIDGLTIYFGAYLYDPVAGSPKNKLIPPNKEHTLSVIFVPTHPVGPYTVDVKTYYFLKPVDLPGGIDPNPDPHVKMTDKSFAASWVTNYGDKKAKVLEKHMTHNQKETKAIWFKKTNFTEFIDLINCGGYNDGSPAVEFSHISVTFATYESKEKLPAPYNNYKIGDKMTLVFGLIEKNESDPEETQYIPVSLYKKSLDKEGRNVDDYDTGIPIPPGVSGGDSLP
ncbi:MAG: hypothetical protein V4450_04455 [Bacteroidota bacterium]